MPWRLLWSAYPAYGVRFDFGRVRTILRLCLTWLANSTSGRQRLEPRKLMDLAQVPCIREVNAIHPTFAKELGLPIRPTDVEAQKIDGTTLDTHRVVIAAFPVTDKANRVRFFERPS